MSECDNCGEQYTLDIGKESDGLCHDCVHIEVERLRSENEAMRERLIATSEVGCYAKLATKWRCLLTDQCSACRARDLIDALDAARAHED